MVVLCVFLGSVVWGLLWFGGVWLCVFVWVIRVVVVVVFRSFRGVWSCASLVTAFSFVRLQ